MSVEQVDRVDRELEREVHGKFAMMREDLASGMIERKQEIDLCLTALIAREHVLLVGPPGTGKSMLAEALVDWLNGSAFRILLTKFTTPEEVFGPVSLAGLKEDRYRRITDGRLPDCDVAFVDEVFKASSAILNTMLTILNERQFDNDGHRHDCPLQLCVAASNEWPGGNGDGKELGAMFDRFVLRKHVKPIATERGLDRLLWGDCGIGHRTQITPKEIRIADWAAHNLTWENEAREALLQIVHEARQEGIQPGDRRLRKSIGVAQAFAWLNSHTQVGKDDLEILAHTLWDDPAEQPAKLAKIVGKIANPLGMKVNSLLMEAEQILSGTDIRDLASTATTCKKLAEVHKKLMGIGGVKAINGAKHVATEIKRIRLATVEAL